MKLLKVTTIIDQMNKVNSLKVKLDFKYPGTIRIKTAIKKKIAGTICSNPIF